VFSYLYDFFGAAYTVRDYHPETEEETGRIYRYKE
jgi:hypothetical protein